MTERNEQGQFKESTDSKMNSWITKEIANRPGRRLMRRLIDNNKILRQREAEQNGN